MPLTEFAFRWCVDRPVVQSVLIGGSRASHLLGNLRALANGPLPLEAADAVGARLRGPMPAYNR
jgi:aryl-alcohol dehydrogenase-like predicted oxidoreductase